MDRSSTNASAMSLTEEEVIIFEVTSFNRETQLLF
jgi:hypothetical protein